MKLEDVEQRFQSKKFKKAFNDESESASKKLLDQVPNDIEEKYKGALLNWLISWAIKNRTVNIPGNFKASAEIFFQIKEQNLQRFLSKKSIAQISSPEELISVVAQAKPEYDKHIADKAETSRKGEGQNLIYEDDEWKVYIPETKGASCALGKGTDWCTAAPGLEFYEDYHKPNDPLIIFISKKDPSEKYQFHYGRRHFMDKNDAPLKDDKLFYRLNEIVKSLKDVMPDRVKQGDAGYDYKILDNGGYYIKKPGMYKYYDKEGRLHREDGPAVRFEGSHAEWRRHGKYHREDAPAVIFEKGDKHWYLNGKLHREDGPAVEFENGDKEWYLNGERHREDGPAIERQSGHKYWYLNGELHREDGPAIERANGDKEWYLNGKELSHSEWKEEVVRL